MSTAIFFSLPFSGHVNPALPLIRELVQRGEEIFFYTTEEFRERVAYTGAHFRSYGTYDLTGTSLTDNPFKVMNVYLSPLQALMEKCVPEAQAIQPDYIIHDTSIPWGSFIAELLQVPSVGSQAVLLIKSNMLLSNISQAVRMMSFYMNARKEASAIDTLVKTVAKQYHVQAKPLLESIHYNGDLTIVYTSRAFQPMEHLFDKSFVFIGSSVEERGESFDFPLEQLDGHPVIYISFGTIFNKQPEFYRTCLAAFGDTPYKVVIATGPLVQIDELGPLPANFLVDEYVPQSHILPRTALFISHGGINSVMEALWHSVPLLMFPVWGDQFWTAQHTEKLGAGKVQKNLRITASRLRALAESVLSQPSYAQASKRLGESLHTAGGVSRAADAIEELKQRKHILSKAAANSITL
jgi:MGT family glycosyltransferase